MSPCTLTNITYDIDLPEDNELQVRYVHAHVVLIKEIHKVFGSIDVHVNNICTLSPINQSFYTGHKKGGAVSGVGQSTI